MSGEREDETARDLHREVMLRLYRGAVHSLNNAFTAALGEASFLADEYKHDPEVQEACAQVIEQIDRSATILRDVGACDERAATGSCDLRSLLRKLGPLLESTSGSQHAYHVEIPESAPSVDASFADVQLALLATIHALVPPRSEGTRVRIEVQEYDASGPVTLGITVAPREGAPTTHVADLAAVRAFVERIGATLREVPEAQPSRVELDLPREGRGE